MKLSAQWGIPVVIVLLALAFRLPGIGSTMTADEARWMERSSQFIHAIEKGDIHGTFLTTHPGVVPMWLMGSGIALQEKRLGLTYDQDKIPQFRRVVTIPIALATSLLIGLLTVALRYVLNQRFAVMSGFLLAIDPYFVGLSRIGHLDALLAIFMANALLFWFWYRRTSNKWLLLAAGILGGLAGATKLLPALWLLVTITALEVLTVWPWSISRLVMVIKRLVVYVVIAACTIVAIWPALWQPQHFGNVYYTSGLYDAYRGDIKRLALEDQVPTEDTTESIEPASFYPRTLISRTTPFTLLISLGVLIAVIRVWIATWRRRSTINPHSTMFVTTWLLLYAIGFLGLITTVGKKSDRYALPALIILPIVAGIAMASLWSPLMHWLRQRGRLSAGLLGTVFLILLLLAQTGLWYPYFSVYASPVGSSLIPSAQRGWGEGLDAAAAWLNTRPQTSDMMVASWYPTVFGTYFHGKTIGLSARNDSRVAYVVLYHNMYGRSNEDDATGVTEEFAHKTPIQTIRIQGEPYAWIYETIGLPYFPLHVGELVGGMEVGQVIPIQKNNWQAIEIGMSNFSGRHNSEDVIVHIKDSPEATSDIRTVTRNASQVVDSDWNRFTFAPIPDSAGKTYYVAIESPDSRPGNAVTVRYSKTDLKPGQMYLHHHPVSGDVAYHLDE